jgi:hypothetical protein
MSNLTDTKRAYDRLGKLLDAEVLKRKGSAKELEKLRVSLDIAFYLLGWAQFEYLVRQEANEMIKEKARGKTIDGKAWQFLEENIKTIPVRRRLDMIFHGDQATRDQLHKDYTVRSEAAHDYKMPKEARDVSDWLQVLETLVGKFDT